LDGVVNAWRYIRDENRREEFRSLLQRFIRLYGFVSQLISFEAVELEELYVFAKNLNRKLPKREKRIPNEIREAVDLDSILLGFVNTKIDLFKKLTDPAVNAMFKQKWFDGYVLQQSI